MWDRPQSLNALSGALVGLSLLLVLFGVLHYILHLPVFPLRVLQLANAPQRVDAALVEAVAREEVKGNFFTADLDKIRQSFERLPWVRKANVRRQFPWRLEVSLEEHEALAHWNGSRLVNTHGEIFDGGAPPPVRSGRELPRFTGQPEAAAEIARMHRLFGGQLAPLGREIVQISLSPRRAWQLRLDNGMVLELGSEQVEQRLARFAEIYPYSVARMQQDGGPREAVGEQTVKYVDLRYRNGFAVSFAGGARAVKGES